ncbi:unnamed protein product [Meganyctiphanes norvegica]|uniref:Uncharacterized protein n=1 Tax=Meganyctiphanes norvegica TaxID=48144 RepID=A0AAV2QQD8_MEGNR
MAYMSVLLVCVMCGVVSSRPNTRSAATQPTAYPKYTFRYAVTFPNKKDYGHEETRDGDTVTGVYAVNLPDGRLQIVKYSVVGDSGFNATVTYIDGEKGHESEEATHEADDDNSGDGKNTE